MNTEPAFLRFQPSSVPADCRRGGNGYLLGPFLGLRSGSGAPSTGTA